MRYTKTIALLIMAALLSGCATLTERQKMAIKVCCAVVTVGAIMAFQNSKSGPDKRVPDPMCSRFPERCR